MKPYFTVLHSAEYEYIVNKSRFIACSHHIEDTAQAEAMLTKTRQRYRDATHHCYAYILETSGSGSRFSDDGEPGGTAGMPILEVMKKQELAYTITVVTRYFGGIQLGAGGLVRAYTKATVGSLAEAGRGIMEPSLTFEARCAYTYYERIRRTLDANGEFLKCLNTLFEAEISLTLCVKASMFSMVTEQLTTCCDGNIAFTDPTASYELWRFDQSIRKEDEL